MTNWHTPNREEQALREVGHTSVAPGVARLLAIALLLSIASVPTLQSLAEWRGATDEVAAQQPLARLAPQLRAFAGKLPGIARRLAEQGFLAANRSLLAAIDDFENRLEEESILRSWLLPRVQSLQVAWFGQGNEQAYIGRDGWLFYRPDVDYVTGAGFLEPKVLRRRSRSGDTWEEPPQPDPIVALVDFARQLRARDIQLLVVPTPAKPMIHPERFARGFDGSAATLQNPSFRVFKNRLERAGLVVVDLACLQRQPDDHEPRFLRTDTHWTPAAMERAAAALAERIRQSLPATDAPPREFLLRKATVENLGDIATMLRLPPGQQLFAPERVETSVVLTLEGRSWKPDRSAELLLLGDSFTNVYSDPGLGWGATAGLAEQLSYRLRRPLDRIALNAGGSHATRLALARELAAGNDRLAGKKLVIYQFAARELAFGDWQLIELGTS